MLERSPNGGRVSSDNLPDTRPDPTVTSDASASSWAAIRELLEQVSRRDTRLAQLEMQLQDWQERWEQLETSKGWKIVQRLRVLQRYVGSGSRSLAGVLRFFVRLGGALFPRTGVVRSALIPARRAFDILRQEGPISLAGKIERRLRPFIAYQVWFRATHPTTRELRRQRADSSALAYRPLISIVMPVYRPPLKWLRAAIESVLAQSYANWELCIADDASKSDALRQYLEATAVRDARIKIVYRSENGHISRASNSAMEMASGEFICMLDHDDLLYPNALFEAVSLLNTNPTLDLIYSDSDIVQGRLRRSPFFKPDWSPDLFLNNNYLNHLTVLRKSLVDAVGGFVPGLEGSQDYDLYLRVIAGTQPARIAHIPSVLYGWRASPDSAAGDLANKAYAVDAGRRALSRYLDPIYSGVVIRSGLLPNTFEIVYPAADGPLVSLIVSGMHIDDQLPACLESLRKYAAYSLTQTIVLGKKPPNLADDLSVMFLPPAGLSAEAHRNLAVRKAQGQYLLFVDAAARPLTPHFLSYLIRHARRDGIGIVGPKLLTPSAVISSAGLVLGREGSLYSHACRGIPNTTNHFEANVARNCLGLSDAFVLLAKDKFEAVGGYSEEFDCIEISHVDLCLRLHESGQRHVYTPFVMVQYEGAPQPRPDPKATEAFRAKWGPYLQRDPYYSPRLSRKRSDFSL